MSWTVIITGASRGIGLELARRYAERGDRVLATARHPSESPALAALAGSGTHLSVHALDVASHDSIGAFARSLAGSPVDLLVNNAGIGGSHARIADADLSDAIDVYRTNALGPLLLVQALLPNLRAGTGKRIAHVTSRMGSITDHPSGGYYAYRMSKAALNMASVNMAVDLRADRIVSVVLNPGWVKTDMGGGRAPTNVETSVAGMMKVIDTLGPRDSGKGYHFDGSEIPY